MNEPLLTVVGNVAGPPRHRTLPTGVAVADFRIAATPRRHDRAADTWSDGETIWFGVTVWRALAEHCSSSLKKGDKVVVSGRLSTRSWVSESGERRANLEIDATSVGLDLARGAAGYVKAPTLVTDEDPWVSSGIVDPVTGEVLQAEPDEDGAAEELEPAIAAAA